MFFTRQQLEEIEDKSLAPYGARSKDSKDQMLTLLLVEVGRAFNRQIIGLGGAAGEDEFP